MGQDQVYLQVIAESGSGNASRDALKVLKVLQRGRHWVLVSLLLANVITNETLPIVLDQDVKGGWFAVLASTILIVIFGEIIPQSICAKHGLAIGAWSSRQVRAFVSRDTSDLVIDMYWRLCMRCIQ
jgi:metal transporter CNNM